LANFLLALLSDVLTIFAVSFQDSYPPTFQLASKEYSHMIRRGSIAPLAARIRANRPPTAPPVSIFLSEPGTKPGMQMESRQRQTAPVEADTPNLPSDEAKKENNAANCNVQQQQQQQQDYNFPLYVCSIKERECWKLHQKMSAKGVSVSYETVLRGMLTPTEFRHFQKQREHEEAKAQEAADAEAEAALAVGKDSTSKKTPATAIERLSESLLQSKWAHGARGCGRGPSYAFAPSLNGIQMESKRNPCLYFVVVVSTR